MKNLASIAIVWAVTITLQNVALSVAIFAFVVAGLALLIVNYRLDKFQQKIEAQTQRLDDFEKRVPSAPTED